MGNSSSSPVRPVDIAIRRSEEWLEKNKQTFISETDTGITFKDNFADLLIVELSGRWDYTDLRIPDGRWHYFAEKPVIVPDDYPTDNDTNAVAFSIVKPNVGRAKAFVDEIANCKNSDGIIQVHLDPNRPRIAPEVSANIIALFYSYDRADEVVDSLRYLEKALVAESYEESRYYFVPELLLFYTWRLLCIASGSKPPIVKNEQLPKELYTLREHLIRRVKARIGFKDTNAISPAIRLLICRSMSIPNAADTSILLKLQQNDGGFGKAWYVRYGSNGIKIAHQAFACVIALAALRMVRDASDG